MIVSKANAGEGTVEDVTHLIQKRRRNAVRQHKAAAISSRALGIWIGLTFELAIHLAITTIEHSILEAYNEGTESHNESAAYGYAAYYDFDRFAHRLFDCS